MQADDFRKILLGNKNAKVRLLSLFEIILYDESLVSSLSS